MSDRTTEFRGRDSRGVWHYGDYADGRIYVNGTSYEVWEDTVGERTGAIDFLKDEIFEDDVVTFNTSKKTKYYTPSDYYIVVFDEEEYRFMIESLDGKFIRLPLSMFSHKDIEIEGTIFDDEFREQYAIHNRLE